MLRRVILLYGFLLIFSKKDHAKAQCPSGTCVCSTPSGTINLQSLSNPDTDYRFTSTYDGYNYYYSPCSGLNYATCSLFSQSAVCQENGEQTTYFSTGSIGSEQIVVEGDEISIKYTGGDDGRNSIVKLICDPYADTPVFEAKGEPYTLEYDFELKTKCACYDGCNDDTPTEKPTDHDDPSSTDKKIKVAAGEIGIGLMAFALVIIVAYFTAGGIVLHFKYGKKGVEVIPQRSFWLLLPILVKDGIVFTFTPLVNLIKNRGYQKI